MSAHTQKISSLESLRGIAAFIVLIDHAINVFSPNFRWTNIDGSYGVIRKIVAWTPLNLIYSGIPSVLIFFLLSGFVLSIKPIKKFGDPEPIINGISKRYLRLVIPILGASVLACIAAAAGCLTFGGDVCNYQFKKVIVDAVYNAPFVGGKLVINPLWTISWEIYGSFIIFIILFLLTCSRNVVHTAIIIIFSLYQTRNSHYSLFIIGMSFCLLYSNGFFEKIKENNGVIKSSILSLLLITSLLMLSYPYKRDGVSIGPIHSLFPSSGDWRGDYAYYTKIGAVIFFFVFLSSDLFQKIIDNKVTKFLGYVSFSMYILHSPIYYFSRNLLNVGKLQGYEFFVFVPLLILFVLFVSWCFAKTVDEFSIRASNKFGSRVAEIIGQLSVWTPRKAT